MTFNIELACRRQRKRQKGAEGGGRQGMSAGEAIARRSSVCMRCLKMRARMMKCLARKCRERERHKGRDRELYPSRSRGAESEKNAVKFSFASSCFRFVWAALLLKSFLFVWHLWAAHWKSCCMWKRSLTKLTVRQCYMASLSHGLTNFCVIN